MSDFAQIPLYVIEFVTFDVYEGPMFGSTIKSQEPSRPGPCSVHRKTGILR
jgi:hypothetical protein